jgi:hypothetical protein
MMFRDDGGAVCAVCGCAGDSLVQGEFDSVGVLCKSP